MRIRGNKFSMHSQSDSEHELTEQCTSLNCHSFPFVPVLRYTVCFFVVEQRRPRLVCGTGTAGWFCFPAVAGVFFCRAVQPDFVRCLLSVLFSLSAHRFLCVLIWNPSLAWKRPARCTLRGSRSKRSGDLCLPCLVWKARCFVFVSVLAHISIFVPAVVSLGCAD